MILGLDRRCLFSRVQLFVPPWTVAHQASLFTNFSRQEYWEWVAIAYSRVSSQPRDGTRISYVSCIAGRFFTTEPLGKLLGLDHLSL